MLNPEENVLAEWFVDNRYTEVDSRSFYREIFQMDYLMYVMQRLLMWVEAWFRPYKNQLRKMIISSRQ